MSSRLVLIDCTGDHISPWLKVQRGDSDIEVIGLGQGEHIVIETNTSEVEVTVDGVSPLPPGPQFRVHKRNAKGSSTFVSVLNGRRIA